MTARAHVRRGVLGRLIHRSRPAARTSAYLLPSEYPHPPQAAASTPRQQRPPWDTQPQPALTSPARGQRHPVYGQDEPRLYVPPGLVRSYAPEPQPEPVAYPPLPPISADYQDLRVFPAVVRGACRVGLRGIGVRQGGALPPLPGYDPSRYDGATGGAS